MPRTLRVRAAAQETQLLQSEMLRISEGQRMPALDMSRLQMDVPAHNRQNDPAAWRQAVQNAQSQLEHQANRLDNVELFQQHGASAWRAHLVQLEGMVRNLQQQQEEVRTRTEEINKKRKYEQLEAAKKLLALEDEWLAAVQKNRMIEAATERARADHAALERAGSLAAS